MICTSYIYSEIYLWLVYLYVEILEQLVFMVVLLGIYT